MDLTESKPGMSFTQMKVTMVAIAIAAFLTGLRVMPHYRAKEIAFAFSVGKILLLAALSILLYIRVTRAFHQQNIERARLFCLVVLLINAISIVGDSIVLIH